MVGTCLPLVMLSSILLYRVVLHDVGKQEYPPGVLAALLGEELASEKAASSHLLVLRLPGGSRTRRERTWCATQHRRSPSQIPLCVSKHTDKPAWTATYMSGTLNVSNMKCVMHFRMVRGFTRAVRSRTGERSPSRWCCVGVRNVGGVLVSRRSAARSAGPAST